MTKNILILKMTVLSAGLAFLSGCGNNFNFQGSQPTAAASTTASTPSAVGCNPQTASDLKIVTVWDASGSTKGDDGKASIRAQTMLDFLSANASQTNLSYSFSFFSAGFSMYDFLTPSWESQQVAFSEPTQAFGSQTQAVTAVNSFVSLFNAGKINGSGTNYQEAFQSIQSAIAADFAKDPKASYVVIFMSDGEPNMGPSTVDTIDPLVTSLMNSVGPGHISVSTVYFWTGSPTPLETSIMQNIASTGQGQFLSVGTTNNSAGSLNLNTMIQNLITVPGVACQ